MNPEQVTTIVTSVLQGGGIVTFLYFYVRGLRARINSLEGTIKAQEQTLSVMERRVLETERIGSIYRNLISDLPKDLENYKAVISQTKDVVILELTNRNREKDQEIALLRDAEAKLKALPLAEKQKRRAVKVVIYLYEDKNKELLELVKLLDNNLDLIVDQLVLSESLETLFPAVGGNLSVVNSEELNLRRWMGPESTPPSDFLSARWSRKSGSMIAFEGKKVLMDKARHDFLNDSILKMHEYIERN